MVIHGGWDVGNVYYDCTYILNTGVASGCGTVEG